MPRPRPKTRARLRSAVELTESRLRFLFTHHDYFDERPFADDDEARVCWEAHAEELLGERQSVNLSPTSFLPGTRPWAFWKFELNTDVVPDAQAVVLDEMGLMDPEEKAAAVKLARKAWEAHIVGWNPEARKRALRATDQQLLDVWPAIWAVDIEEHEGE